ncbi:FAD-dependent oxidoreductase [Bacillus cereus]
MKHELVIVGGGIIGKALALNLVNNNVKVLLVDPNLNNGIATTAAGGMLGAFGEITYDKVGDLDKKNYNSVLMQLKCIRNGLRI